MQEEGTSEKNEVAWEVSKTKVELMNKKASAFCETPSSVQRCPLSWWVPGISMAGRLAVEQNHPSLPITRIHSIHTLEVLHFPFRNLPKASILFCRLFIKVI